ncbi:hypothetical protein D8674_028848 [Pyrus ussuriensis x Pyrus communis]|uniref:Ycf49-like protein n=1 Tax=Pyrus ussuriensis x Pyrus communis TaxID=2448454 RepID=A0A5N5I288_9ROSA|nr:hypothetical protein D8674_028848 [Pyrus ussuriensis x Pyrus communis]
MAMHSLLHLPKPTFPRKPLFPPRPKPQTQPPNSPKNLVGLLGAGLTLAFVGPALASELLPLNEPSNALSLPTWAIHVSSVVEWVTAMALVWQYGEKSGFESWKGLSWGMVLVALQAALTVIGNATMCFAAYRIYRSSEERSKNL